MNLPALPTDNLYKFVALSGVAILLFGVFLLYSGVEGFYRRSDELTLERAIVNARYKNLERAIDVLERRAFPSRAQVDELRSAHAEVIITRVTLEEKSRALERATDRFLKSSLLIGLMETVGLALAFVGFFLWYFRLQRYQDRQVRTAAARPQEPSVPAPPPETDPQKLQEKPKEEPPA